MSLDLSTWAWTARGISTTEKIVLLDIAERANAKGIAWPSVDEIMDRTLLGRTAVYAAIRILKVAKLLNEEWQPGRRDVPAIVRNTDNGHSSPQSGIRNPDNTQNSPPGAQSCPLSETPNRYEPVIEPVREPVKEDISLAGQQGQQLRLDGDSEQLAKVKHDRHTHVAALLLTELSQARIRADKSFRVLTSCESNLKDIRARLKEGRTKEEIRHVIAVCEQLAKRNAMERKYFNANDPFKPDWMSRYLSMTGDDAQRVGTARQERAPPRDSRTTSRTDKVVNITTPEELEAATGIRIERGHEQRDEENPSDRRHDSPF